MKAWKDGAPHRAWEIIDAAGMKAMWPDFQRGMLDHARERYERHMGLRV